MTKLPATRFLIISDTHAATFLTDKTWHLPRVDVLLHCGDLSNSGSLADYRRTISLLRSVPAELKLVIAGNHDKTLDGQYWKSFVERMQARGLDLDPELHCQAKELWTSNEMKRDGIFYLEEGTHKFTLRSGATFTIYASPYQPEFMDWAFMYGRSEDRFNKSSFVRHIAGSPAAKEPVPKDVDIVMTHGPAALHLDKCKRDGNRAGCQHLWRALERVRPRLHCCGHIHEGYGTELVQWADKGGKHNTQTLEMKRVQEDWTSFDAVEVAAPGPAARGSSTILLNASVLDERYQPAHAPILVKLDLGREK